MLTLTTISNNSSQDSWSVQISTFPLFHFKSPSLYSMWYMNKASLGDRKYNIFGSRERGIIVGVRGEICLFVSKVMKNSKVSETK